MLDSTYVAFGCKRPGMSRSDRFAPDAPRCSFASSLPRPSAVGGIYAIVEVIDALG